MPGSIDGVATRIAIGVSRRRREGRRIEPCGGVVRAGGEDLLPGYVGADRILADDGSCVGGVSKDRDGEGEPRFVPGRPWNHASRG